MNLPDPVMYAVPAFVVAMVAEAALSRKLDRSMYEIGDTSTSLLLGFGHLISAALFGWVFYGVLSFVYRFHLLNIGVSWLSFLAAFVAYDFCYYWGHRYEHEIRLGWAAHMAHHSSQHFNFASALRQPWIDVFTAIGWLPTLLMPLIGFTPELTLFTIGTSLIYAFFSHTEFVRRLWASVEYVLVTPSHHRVHHAVNPRYLDANYGNTFILWDRWFGTFVGEDDAEPCRYGLVHNVGTFNPARIALGELISMGKDVRRSPSLRAALGYIFGPPGYSHDGSRRTSAMIRVAAGLKADRKEK